MTRSGESDGASSIRTLAPVCCCKPFIMFPAFPITPPILEAWQRRRKDTCPEGTGNGAAEAEGWGFERLLAEDPFG